MRARTLITLWLCILLFSCGGKSTSSQVLGIPSTPETPHSPGVGPSTSNPFANSENQRFSGGSSGFYQSGQFRVYGNVTFQAAGPISSERFRIRSQSVDVGEIGIQLQRGVSQ